MRQFQAHVATRFQSWYSLLTLLFLFTTILNEVLPFAFGTGRAAIFPAWGFVYVTLRFIALPLSALALLAWGLFALLQAVRHKVGFPVRTVLLLVVPAVFITLSYFVPLPWLFVAVYGTNGPSDVSGWFR